MDIICTYWACKCMDYSWLRPITHHQTCSRMKRNLLLAEIDFALECQFCFLFTKSKWNLHKNLQKCNLKFCSYAHLVYKGKHFIHSKFLDPLKNNSDLHNIIWFWSRTFFVVVETFPICLSSFYCFSLFLCVVTSHVGFSLWVTFFLV